MTKFRLDLRAQSLFMEILCQPRRVTRQLRLMNQYGVFSRLSARIRLHRWSYAIRPVSILIR